MTSESGVHPGQVVRIGDPVELSRPRVGDNHQLNAVHHLAERPGRQDHLPGDVHDGLAVMRNRGVQVHDLAYALGNPVSHAGDDHAAVAVAYQHDITEVPVVQLSLDIADVKLQ